MTYCNFSDKNGPIFSLSGQSETAAVIHEDIIKKKKKKKMYVLSIRTIAYLFFFKNEPLKYC